MEESGGMNRVDQRRRFLFTMLTALDYRYTPEAEGYRPRACPRPTGPRSHPGRPAAAVQAVRGGCRSAIMRLVRCVGCASTAASRSF
jgi:hypothetical protein